MSRGAAVMRKGHILKLVVHFPAFWYLNFCLEKKYLDNTVCMLMLLSNLNLGIDLFFPYYD